jgi:uncharacterized protein (DUF433 family)
MRLDDYFDFLDAGDIRLKGTRISIETILFDYLDLGLFPEQIATRYRNLTLEQVYATFTYYWRNRQELDAYLHRLEEEDIDQRRAQDRHPSPAIQRLRQLAQQNTQPVDELAENPR